MEKLTYANVEYKLSPKTDPNFRAAFIAYVTAVLRNTALKQKRDFALRSMLIETRESVLSDAICELEKEGQKEFLFDNEALIYALRTLTKKQQSVLEYSFIDRMTVKEIAQKLKVSHQVVSGLLRRALENMRVYEDEIRDHERRLS